MLRRSSLALALVALAIAMLASTAFAATSKGKLVAYNTKTFELKLTNRHKTKKFRLNKDTACGVQKGQSGDALACDELAKAVNKGKDVRVVFAQQSDGTRLASVVTLVQPDPVEVTGKLISYKSKTQKLKIDPSGKGTLTVDVDDSTVCSTKKGGTYGSLDCSDLAKKKMKKKTVQVQYIEQGDGSRLATSVVLLKK